MNNVDALNVERRRESGVCPIRVARVKSRAASLLEKASVAIP